MLPSEIDFVRRCIPGANVMQYHPDRESAWLLAERLRAPSLVRDLRAGPLGKFLNRPSVKPVVAACGGVLGPDDVAPAARPEDFAASPDLSRAALAGLAAAFEHDWLDFELRLSHWGTAGANTWQQMSRAGGNLVLQLGFPSDHAALMGRYLGQANRKWFECTTHPVRQFGRPTLAWARIDADMDSGVALIEEVQSDWLRLVREEAEALQVQCPRSRELRVAQTYDAELRRRYGKIWPKAMLLAALQFVSRELGCREIWMHQPQAGAILKNIWGTPPPRSLYTDLPRSFGFAPTDTPPPFLRGYKAPKLERLRRAGTSLFWHLAL